MEKYDLSKNTLLEQIKLNRSFRSSRLPDETTYNGREYSTVIDLYSFMAANY